MVGKTTTQRKKPVRRPLKARLDEAKKKLDRIQNQLDVAQEKYEKLHAKYLKSEQMDKVDAIKTKFKKGEALSAEETDILRKVM
jgi:uncharacterized coiled-coil DUF342 family protein